MPRIRTMEREGSPGHHDACTRSKSALSRRNRTQRARVAAGGTPEDPPVWRCPWPWPQRLRGLSAPRDADALFGPVLGLIPRGCRSDGAAGPPGHRQRQVAAVGWFQVGSCAVGSGGSAAGRSATTAKKGSPGVPIQPSGPSARVASSNSWGRGQPWAISTLATVSR